MSEDEENV